MSLETDVTIQISTQKQALLEAESDPESFQSILQAVRNLCTLEHDVHEKGVMDIQRLAGLTEEDINTVERMDLTCAIHIFVKPLENTVYGTLRVGTMEGRILTSTEITNSDIHAAIAVVCNVLLKPVLLKNLPWLDFYFNRSMDVGFIDKVLTGTQNYTDYTSLTAAFNTLINAKTNIILHDYVPDGEWETVEAHSQSNADKHASVTVVPMKHTPKEVLKMKLQGVHLARRRALALYNNIKPVNSEFIDGECCCIYHDWLRMNLPIDVDAALHNIHMQHQVYDLDKGTHTCTKCGCTGSINVKLFKCTRCGYTKKYIEEEWAEDIYCGICPNCGDSSGFNN